MCSLSSVKHTFVCTLDSFFLFMSVWLMKNEFTDNSFVSGIFYVLLMTKPHVFFSFICSFKIVHIAIVNWKLSLCDRSHLRLITDPAFDIVSEIGRKPLCIALTTLQLCFTVAIKGVQISESRHAFIWIVLSFAENADFICMCWLCCGIAC